jgi:hypothetical protein
MKEMRFASKEAAGHPPVEDPPGHPKHPPVEEPGRTPEEPPPPSRPPIKDPGGTPRHPPVEEPPPEDPRQSAPG